ncbi:hypothetical protein DL96DRAFT_1595904 [Flagelloscypha sp. PMI_526]|nr:hypothetical protein DL96DRAFT_1595904 [Flagelloscypha sp. PMI_526]
MEENHNLPHDILRLLFEYSASTSTGSAKMLSLVSKEVQGWTDPYLFKTIQELGDTYSGISATSVLGRMLMTDASPRIVLARNYVRALAWRKFIPNLSYIRQALESFPNLTQLCLWGSLFPSHARGSNDRLFSFAVTQNYPSLRRVATCIESPSNISSNSFGSPFWMNITHLQVKYSRTISSSVSALELPLFTNMSSLTHLSLLCTAGGSEANTDLAFSRVRNNFPPSLILCLLDLKAPLDVDRKHWLDEMASSSFKVDKRIVMWSSVLEDDADEVVVSDGSDGFQAWCEFQDGLQTFWEKGESVLKRRQDRLGAV